MIFEIKGFSCATKSFYHLSLQFTVFINDRKSRSGKKVEVAIYGEPGAYVGLSSLDYPFYGLQAGNELTYAKVKFVILCLQSEFLI